MDKKLLANDIETGLLSPSDTEKGIKKDNKNDGKKSDPKKETVCTDDRHNYESLKYRFWMQVAMTTVVTAFCITMIGVNNGERDSKEGIYLPVLTGLLGYWLPAPDARIKRPVITTEKDAKDKTT